MKKFFILPAIGLALLSIYCGDPVVEIEDQYEPKIVVEGFVYPNETISNIKLTRNFRLNQTIDSSAIILSPGNNQVNASVNGVPLEYDAEKQSYFTGTITGEYGKSYTLEISAVIDGRQLNTSATTTVPAQGFDFLYNSLGTIPYRSQDIILAFHLSPGTDFYGFSVVPAVATPENYIYDNPYEPGLEEKDVEDNLNAYKFQFAFLINVDSYGLDTMAYKVRPLDYWFYTDYTVIAYAGDRNFRNFVLTAPRVQEFDGNFHEPEIHFEGDGVGVFGSAVKDTLTFSIVPNQ